MERGEPQNEDDDRCIIEYHILMAEYVVHTRSILLALIVVRRFLNNETSLSHDKIRDTSVEMSYMRVYNNL